MTVNIHEAKTRLSQLIERTLAGEDVVIAKAGRPVARLTKVRPRGRRILGSAAGTIRYKKGWDAPMSGRELREFLGR